MRTLIAFAAMAAMTSACVIVVDGDDDWDDDHDSFRMSFAADMAGPIQVAESNDLQAFTSIDASAGTDVTVVKGDTYLIRLNERAIGRTSFEVRGDTLKISCNRPCGKGSRGQVEVVTPSIEALNVSSGAQLEVSDEFNTSEQVSLNASSGGRLEAKMLKANAATVSASSGASVHLSASDALRATASSGARIRYQGDPEKVSVSESSGGSVRGH